MRALLQITTNEYHQFGPLFATVPAKEILNLLP